MWWIYSDEKSTLESVGFKKPSKKGLKIVKYVAWTMINVYLLLLSEFFTLTLADGFPLESQWQEATSSLLESS